MNLPAYCTALLAAKSTSGLTFAQIADSISKPEVWTTALFYGQAHADATTAQQILDALKVSGSVSHTSSVTGEAKSMQAEVLVAGLSGQMSGVEGMVVRGGTWEWPPKVRRSPRVRADEIGPGYLPSVRSLGRLRMVVQSAHPGKGKRIQF